MTTASTVLAPWISFSSSREFRTFRVFTGIEMVDRFLAACARRFLFLRSRAAHKESLHFKMAFVIDQLKELYERRSWYTTLATAGQMKSAQAEVYQRVLASIEGFQAECQRLHAEYRQLLPPAPERLQLETMYDLKEKSEIGFLETTAM